MTRRPTGSGSAGRLWFAVVLALGPSVLSSTAVHTTHPQKAPDPDMREHFVEIMTVHTALIRGDLPTAKDAARQLAARPIAAETPESTRSYARQITQSAARVADTAELLTAGTEAAKMLEACGGCHRTAGVVPAYERPERPELGGVVGHMLEHQRAADQLLESFIVPTPAAWTDGMSTLTVAPLHEDKFPRDPGLRSDVLDAEKQLHALATEAVAAGQTANQTDIYGQMIAVCAECHKLHPELWGPPKR